MSRSRIAPRWTLAVLLAGAAAMGAAGCVAVPVGGYGPSVVLPAPGVVIAPGHGHHHRRHYGHYGHRGSYRHRGHWR
jgi:hypothetical protein